MSRVSNHGKQLATMVANILGVERPPVRRSTWHDHAADLLVGVDTPWSGVTTLATLNLSNRNTVLHGAPQSFGVELVACHHSAIEGCIDAVYDAAFLHLEHHTELYPGAVLPDLIGRRSLSETMRHFFLATPFLWNERLTSLRTDDREVRYLLAVPTSDQEMALAGTEGSEALEDVFEQRQIDAFDWHRPSVVDPE